ALTRRRAGDDPRNPRHLRHRDGHDRGGDQRVAAARRVGADRVHRQMLVPQHHPGQGFDLDVMQALSLQPGEVAHLVEGELQVTLQLVGDRLLGLGDGLGPDPEVLRAPVVEPRRVAAHGRQTLALDRRQDLGDDISHLLGRPAGTLLSLLQVVRHLSSCYWAVYPPSTSKLAPVMNEAEGDARWTTALATSSMLPRRPSGMRPITSARNASSAKKGSVIGVATKLGATELTRMRCGASSTASAFVRPSTA